MQDVNQLFFSFFFSLLLDCCLFVLNTDRERNYYILVNLECENSTNAILKCELKWGEKKQFHSLHVQQMRRNPKVGINNSSQPKYNAFNFSMYLFSENNLFINISNCTQKKKSVLDLVVAFMGYSMANYIVYIY